MKKESTHLVSMAFFKYVFINTLKGIKAWNIKEIIGNNRSKNYITY